MQFLFCVTPKNEALCESILRFLKQLKITNHGHIWLTNRSSLREVFCKKVFLKISQNLQENTCARVSFLIKLQVEACNFIKIETLAQVFSSEFSKGFKNVFFIEHLQCLLLTKNIQFQKSNQ